MDPTTIGIMVLVPAEATLLTVAAAVPVLLVIHLPEDAVVVGGIMAHVHANKLRHKDVIMCQHQVVEADGILTPALVLADSQQRLLVQEPPLLVKEQQLPLPVGLLAALALRGIIGCLILGVGV